MITSFLQLIIILRKNEQLLFWQSIANIKEHTYKYFSTYPIDPPSPTPVTLNQNHHSSVKDLQAKRHEIREYSL